MLKDKTVGIIGAGDIVFAAHLPFLKSAAAKPVWILDVAEKNVTAAAKAFDIPLALKAADIQQAPDTDLVLIACPYGVRQPYYSFLRGKRSALYIEKPVAKRLQEHQDIMALREDHAICAGFLRRSMGITNTVKGIIESELFGQLRHVRSEFGTATQISSGGGFAKNVQLAGGGQLLESAIHNIDAICYMAGVHSARVLRKKMIHENGFDLHTEALIELSTPQQQSVGLELLVTCFKSTNYEIVMQFDNATLTFSLFKDIKPEIRSHKGGPAFRISDVLAGDQPSQPYEVLHAFWNDFMQAADSGAANYTNLCATLATTSIIEALYSPEN
ncbi:MAG: Inositol 2-dehydrogenase/D-chiro-inositol 3-dehydrogenase [Bacteroidota bacterium]|jgi:predicted dehydrogenase